MINRESDRETETETETERQRGRERESTAAPPYHRINTPAKRFT